MVFRAGGIEQATYFRSLLEDSDKITSPLLDVSLATTLLYDIFIDKNKIDVQSCEDAVSTSVHNQKPSEAKTGGNWLTGLVEAYVFGKQITNIDFQDSVTDPIIEQLVEAADFYFRSLEFEVLLQDHANNWPKSLREAVAELRTFAEDDGDHEAWKERMSERLRGCEFYEHL